MSNNKYESMDFDLDLAIALSMSDEKLTINLDPEKKGAKNPHDINEGEKKPEERFNPFIPSGMEQKEKEVKVKEESKLASEPSRLLQAINLLTSFYDDLRQFSLARDPIYDIRPCYPMPDDSKDPVLIKKYNDLIMKIEVELTNNFLSFMEDLIEMKGGLLSFVIPKLNLSHFKKYVDALPPLAFSSSVQDIMTEMRKMGALYHSISASLPLAPLNSSPLDSEKYFLVHSSLEKKTSHRELDSLCEHLAALKVKLGTKSNFSPDQDVVNLANTLGRLKKWLQLIIESSNYSSYNKLAHAAEKLDHYSTQLLKAHYPVLKANLSKLIEWDSAHLDRVSEDPLIIDKSKAKEVDEKEKKCSLDQKEKPVSANLCQIAQYVNLHYLSKPYPAPPISELPSPDGKEKLNLSFFLSTYESKSKEIDKKMVHRNSTGIVQALRCARYLPEVVQFLIRQTRNESLKQSCSALSTVKISWMQAAILFSLSGRVSALVSDQDDCREVKFRTLGATNFERFVKDKLHLPREQTDVRIWLKEFTGPLKQIGNLAHRPLTTASSHGYSVIFNLAYCLDEIRLFSQEEYHARLSKILTNSGGIKNPHALRLLEDFAVTLLIATGDRMPTYQTSKGKSLPAKDYASPFGSLSHDVSQCWTVLSRLNPEMETDEKLRAGESDLSFTSAIPLTSPENSTANVHLFFSPKLGDTNSSSITPDTLSDDPSTRLSEGGR